MINRRTTPLPPPRVRHEPPTVSEAFAAARDLTGEPERQIEIAAGLMGATVEEVRPHFDPAAARRSAAAEFGASARPARRTLVVERRRRIVAG